MARQFSKYLTRVHKWAGLVLGLQIFLWFASGFFMTFFPINEVRGRHLAEAAPVYLEQADIIPIEIAMTAYDGRLEGARLVSLAGTPAYVLSGDQGKITLNAKTGALFSELGEGEIRGLAARYYKGEAQIGPIQRITDKAPREYGGPLPVWQVEFADKSKTRLYITAQTGELKAVRTRLWRAFDVAWRFHIMDVTGEDSFNTWWLKLASFLAALFALSGFGLLWHRLTAKRRIRRSA